MASKKEVLVICQSTSGRLSLGIMLNRLWYEPVLARNVLEALRLIEEETISLIILDGDAPEADRSGAISFLRSTETIRRIPIIVVLTAGNDSMNTKLLSEGCAAVITKPVDISLAYGILGKLSGDVRKSARAPVRIRVDIAERVPAPSLFSINISEGGIYLRTAAPLPENTVLHLSFTLPHDLDKLMIAGKVVRNASLGIKLAEEPGMGINFIGASDDVRTRIRNFVTWSLSNDIEWETDL